VGEAGQPIKGDLAESVASLKHQHRGNLLSFGCGESAYELATQGLADEIHFWVNPAVWGSGDRQPSHPQNSYVTIPTRFSRVRGL
jgi:dihydrofolate reductase